MSDYFKSRGFFTAAIIKLTFRTMLKARAYTTEDMTHSSRNRNSAAAISG